MYIYIYIHIYILAYIYRERGRGPCALHVSHLANMYICTDTLSIMSCIMLHIYINAFICRPMLQMHTLNSLNVYIYANMQPLNFTTHYFAMQIHT